MTAPRYLECVEWFRKQDEERHISQPVKVGDAVAVSDEVLRDCCIKCGGDAHGGRDLYGSHFKFEGRICNRCWNAIPRATVSCRSTPENR